MNKTLDTTDLTEAAYLQAEGVVLVGTEKRGHVLHLLFDDSRGWATLRAQQFKDSDQGKFAHDLIRAFRMLRGLALDAKRAEV
jgi:hypothetical protein